MRIAAILSLFEDQGGNDFLASPGKVGGRRLWDTAFPVTCDILGESLLDRTLAKLQACGVSERSVITEENSTEELLPAHTSVASAFVEAWENTVSNYVRNGIDHLLLGRVNAYTDLDYERFLEFHLENSSAITQAYAADDSPLDIALVDASRLRDVGPAYCRVLVSMIPEQRRFLYRGYVNRLASPADFYELIDAGLRGRSDLRPIGDQTREWVWQGADSEIDDSVRITGPVFIGAQSRIAACCTIGAATSIERGCKVDCGTVIQESWVTPGTYLGVALDVRHSIISEDTLFHLDRNVELKIADRHLIGTATKSAPLLAGLGLFFGARTEQPHYGA